MTMLEEKTYRLISTLIEKTEEGKVFWRKTLSDEHYRAQFTGDQVIIRRSTSRRATDGHFYSLSIRSMRGESVEVIRQFPDEKAHYLLEHMFRLAKESAESYVEHSLDNLLQELESR